jgi:hypothetical protein
MPSLLEFIGLMLTNSTTLPGACASFLLCRQTTLLIGICNAIAEGLVQPFLPTQSPDAKDRDAAAADSPPSPTEKSPRRGAPAAKAVVAGKANAALKTKVSTFTITADAAPNFKAALDVCIFVFMDVKLTYHSFVF